LRKAGEHDLRNEIGDNLADANSYEGPDESGGDAVGAGQGGVDEGDEGGVAGTADKSGHCGPQHHCAAMTPNEGEESHLEFGLQGISEAETGPVGGHGSSFGDALGQFFGQELDIGFHEDIFMRAWDETDVYSAESDFAPTEVIFERADECLAASAKQGDRATVRFLNMADQSVEVNLPQFELFLRELSGVDDLFKVDREGGFGPTKAAEEFAREGTGLSEDEAAAHLSIEGDEIVEPMTEITRKTEREGWPPPGNGFVADIRRSAVEQSDERDGFTLGD